MFWQAEDQRGVARPRAQALRGGDTDRRHCIAAWALILEKGVQLLVGWRPRMCAGGEARKAGDKYEQGGGFHALPRFGNPLPFGSGCRTVDVVGA